MTTPCILIVDDDPVIRNSIAEYLRISGLLVDEAEKADQALALLESKKIDVVITDIIMNGMDGLEMTQRIKEKYDTDIIVVTGYTGAYSYEEAIRKGADDFVFKPFKLDELLLRLKRVLRERELTHERDRMLEQLKELAITDGLTQLYNSRHFYQQLEIEINRFNRYSHPLSLLLIDIDHFKRYNDSHGHLEGDKILREAAWLIASCMRNLDSAYRYGGEEFTVILPETDISAAVNVAQRTRETIEKNFRSDADRETITVSIGVAEYAAGDSLTEFIRRADRAMYLAKESGRNRIAQLSP
jgi:two-component system, cell cycle response regulator